jgi:copper chaperone
VQNPGKTQPLDLLRKSATMGHLQSGACQMMTLSIPDMSCGHCKATVEATLATVAGVEAVRVDLAARSVAVDGPADLPAMLAALDKAGYPATVAN